MVRRIRQTAFFWLAAAALVVLAIGAGPSWAQGSGAAPGGNAPSQSAAGPTQNRDAGERGRRGQGDPGGRSDGREHSGRRSENGNGSGSDSSNGASAAKTSPSPTPTAPELSASDRVRAWAKEIVKKNDKNGDSMLQESEWEGLGQSSKADTNGDHVITLDELIAYALRKPGTPTPTPPSGATASAESKPVPPNGDAATDRSAKFAKTPSRSASDAKSARDKQKTYRFKTAKERLPAGLPGWFTAKDANGDGQVEMSEYSHSWSESTAADFKRYDKDNDGIITADEAAKK